MRVMGANRVTDRGSLVYGFACTAAPLPYHIGSRGWRDSKTRPAGAGVYERLTALGPVLDMWDSFQWRRLPCGKVSFVLALAEQYVVCANQHLPWRQWEIT